MKNTIKTLFLWLTAFIKRNKKICIALLVLIVAIVLILIAISILNNNRIGNTLSNLENKGFATIEDNYIYYETRNKICKIKKNGNKPKEITEGTAYYLNKYKNHLYYIEIDKDLEINIIKIKSNGKDKQTFLKDVDLNTMVVAENWVYYFQDKALYKIRTNGKDKIKILEGEILNYTISENYIYYIYNNGEKNVLARKTLERKKISKA